MRLNFAHAARKRSIRLRLTPFEWASSRPRLTELSVRDGLDGIESARCFVEAESISWLVDLHVRNERIVLGI